MTSAAALHPAFGLAEPTRGLELMTTDEMQAVDGGLVKEITWGWRVGLLVGGVAGAVIGAAVVGGVVYALTH
ncbi:MAG: hypothetical protein AMXMBFR53_25760 [Gemmatimonadota bacterium]